MNWIAIISCMIGVIIGFWLGKLYEREEENARRDYDRMSWYKVDANDNKVKKKK